MKEDSLENLLDVCRNRKPPVLSAAFSRDVLREIRLRKDRSAVNEGWIRGLCILFFQPRLFAGSVALALAIGVTLPAALALTPPPSQAAAGLGLNAFSRASAHIPSGLLAGTR